MTQSMKFFDASLAMTSVPKENWIDDFKQNKKEQFFNSSDVWVISEEYPLASNQWRDINVRINHVIDSDTGEKRGDDYKKILFEEIDHPTGPGYQYSFNDNVWLSYSTESIKSLDADTLVRRCNNTLRWLGPDGGLYSVPCSIVEIIKQTRDYATAGSSLVQPAGFFEIYCQFNEFSNKIKANQRFLFGNKDNWTCFRVHGTGIYNYNNQKTYVNESPGIIRLIVGANFVNYDTDDIINGICDVRKSIYTISINESNVIGNIGNKIQLSTKVKFNEETTNNYTGIIWSVDNPDIATIDSNGLLTLNQLGNVEVMASLENNQAVFATVIVTVSSNPILDYEVVISPNVNYVLEDSSQIFNVKLYLNRQLQNNTFNFTLNPNTVTAKNYVYTVIDGNNFKIENVEKFLTDHLTVSCVSVIGSHSKTINIDLKGAW